VLEVIRKFEENQLSAAAALKELQEVASGVVAEANACQDSGLDQRAYGLMKVLETFGVGGADTGGGVAEVREGPPRDSSWRDQGEGAGPPSALTELAQRVDALYTESETAPAGWHRKEQVKKQLRQSVRLEAYRAGFAADVLKDLPSQVEEYAIRHYARVN
jgi:type I restriction enzyme R subunit